MNLVIQNLSFSHDKLRLLKVDFTTNNITTALESLQNYPSGIVYNPENKNIYISDIINSKSISVIDPSKNKVIKNIPIGDDYDLTFERNLIYNPINGYVYLSANDRGLQVIKHK